MICAGYTRNGEYVNEKSLCLGDSGRPLVQATTGILMGVMSFVVAPGCGGFGAPGVFANVANLKKFIVQSMG